MDDIIQQADPLYLGVDDNTLFGVIDRRIQASEAFYEGKNIKDRQKKNKDYLFGKQIDESQLKYYNAHYVDNIIYEAEGTIKPIALSRLPDLLVKPGNESDDISKSVAESITKLVNNDLRKRENRRVLGLSFKHLPVYFVAAIKCIWDPEMGEKGDYRFKVVHPDNIVLDHTSATNSEHDMSYVAEYVQMTVKEAVMMFPKKEKELYEKLGFQAGDEDKESKMATTIKLSEVWFRWPQKKMDAETGKTSYEMINGVIWKFKDLILGKMKNPYWDWAGKPRLYIKEAGVKRPATEEEVLSMTLGIESEQYYFNHFSDPKFPYIFLGYDQWGEMPLDETSRIEQVISLQDNVNKRGKQITEMNDKAKGKHIFSTEGGIEKKTIEEMDMSNPEEDILVDGDVNKVHSFIPGQPAPAQLYKEQEQERQKGFAKMKTHSTTRGEKASDVATTNQILREADFGGIDDLVEETINSAAEEMAGWAMQMIKLFYTVEHSRKLLGKDGTTTMEKITRDYIEDGMEVMVSASGVDKVQLKKEAYERARMKLTDPLTFFQDAGVTDPIGRTNRLMTFMMAPELYKQKYVDKLDTQGMVDKLNAQPVVGEVPGMPTAAPQATTQAPPQAVNAPAGGGGMSNAQMWLGNYGGGSPTFNKTEA